MSILIIAEHNHENFLPATLATIQAASEIKKLDATQHIHLMIIGENLTVLQDKAKFLPEIDEMLVVDHVVYAYQLAENTAALIATFKSDYQYFMMGATAFGKNILPRVAALCNADMVSDVIKIISTHTYVRPIYAGNILATVKSQEPIQFLTIRSTAFKGEKMQEIAREISIKKIDTVIDNHQAQYQQSTLTQSVRPELTIAFRIVSGGRGVKSKDGFKLIEALADTLKAAVGASRAAVDAGFAPNDYQVGQTGKVVAPDLYIAIGISGAIQHLAGMKDSKIVVAINQDPEAPIMSEADYCLVGDLFTLVPALISALQGRE